MEISSALHDELKPIVGDSGILPGAQLPSYTVDGVVPKAVVLPASVPEIQDVLRYAAARHLSVIPTGGGTKLGIGNLSTKVDMMLVTTFLDNIVEYEPADLTVTVEAGIRLAALQEELSRNGQFLPVEPPYAARCTIGGIVAANASGSLRLRHGTARNQVLGLRVVLSDGTVVKSGGRVVKNVAGYDVNKLYIGSFGTLGIISEVTLKLSPLPARQAALIAHFKSITHATNVGLKILQAQLLPDFVNLFLNAELNAFPAKEPTLIVGFGGDSETVTWQLNKIATILEQNGGHGVTLIEGELRRQLQEAIQEFPAREISEDNSDTHVICAKINLKRTDIVEFAEKIKEEAGEMMLLLGNGVLHFRIPIGNLAIQPLADKLAQLREHAVSKQGSLIIESAPRELKKRIDVWGTVGNTAHLMKQLKAKFDANSLLNPGRFVANI